MRKVLVFNKPRNKADLTKFRMFRVEPKSLGISPEDFDMINQDKPFPYDQVFMESSKIIMPTNC